MEIEDCMVTPSELSPIFLAEGNNTYIGVFFQGGSAEDFWRIKCPCGVEVSFSINGLPTVNTPHPCGNPNHWTVKYGN